MDWASFEQMGDVCLDLSLSLWKVKPKSKDFVPCNENIDCNVDFVLMSYEVESNYLSKSGQRNNESFSSDLFSIKQID